MHGLENLDHIISEMSPILNEKKCVFVSVENWNNIDLSTVIGFFNE